MRRRASSRGRGASRPRLLCTPRWRSRGDALRFALMPAGGARVAKVVRRARPRPPSISRRISRQDLFNPHRTDLRSGPSRQLYADPDARAERSVALSHRGKSSRGDDDQPCSRNGRATTVFSGSELALASMGGCRTNLRRARWIRSKGGLRKWPSPPSRPRPPSRRRRA
jgi:hypothetical protein